MPEKNAAFPSLPWTDSFSVGVEVLDDDHRALLRLINEVCARWCGGGKTAALQSFDALSTLAGEHFQREESVLRDLSGYPALDAHAGEHRTRLKQLTALRQRFHETEPEGTWQICNDLVDWFVRQSIGHDAAIKAFFDDRGTRFAGRARQRKTS